MECVSSGVRWTAVAMLLLVVLVAAAPAAARDRLVWRNDRKQLDAQVESWPLAKVLATLAAETGWRVYVAPDTALTVSARFQQLGSAEALRRLFGTLNFALLPQADGSTALFVFRGSVDDATELVRAAARQPAGVPPGTAIPDELLVVLKAGARGGIDALAKRLGATVVGRLDGVRAYRLRFDDAAGARNGRRRLAADPDVASIESNIAIAPPATLTPLSDSLAPALSLTPDVSPSRDGVVIGLIDSAVQSQGSRIEAFVQPGVSVFGDYRAPGGSLTHGTAMAETILDGAQQALREAGRPDAAVRLSILPVDVYGTGESTNSFDVAQGLYEALNRHVNVVNLSLGGENDSPLLRGMIADASSKGVLFVAAAGNEPVTARFYPAADPGVISVTAANAQGAVEPYANRGAWVDAMAPGSNVVSWADRNWVGNGTSFSSSWVTGWAAGTMVNGVRSPQMLQNRTMQRWGMPGG